MRILIKKENLSQDAIKSAILKKYQASDISFEVKDNVLVAMSLTTPASEAQIKEVVESVAKNSLESVVPEPEVVNTPVLDTVASEDLSAEEQKECIQANKVVKALADIVTKGLRGELNKLKSEADASQDEILSELKTLSEKNVAAVSGLETRLVKAEKDYSTLSGRLDSFSIRMDGFASSLKTVESTVSALKSAIDGFMAKFSNLKVELKYGDGK